MIDLDDTGLAALDFVDALGRELKRSDPDAVQLHALDAALSVVLVGKPRALCILAVMARLSGLLRDADGEIRQAGIEAMQLLLAGALACGDVMQQEQRH